MIEKTNNLKKIADNFRTVFFRLAVCVKWQLGLQRQIYVQCVHRSSRHNKSGWCAFVFVCDWAKKAATTTATAEVAIARRQQNKINWKRKSQRVRKSESHNVCCWMMLMMNKTEHVSGLGTLAELENVPERCLDGKGTASKFIFSHFGLSVALCARRSVAKRSAISINFPDEAIIEWRIVALFFLSSSNMQWCACVCVWMCIWFSSENAHYYLIILCLVVFCGQRASAHIPANGLAITPSSRFIYGCTSI